MRLRVVLLSLVFTFFSSLVHADALDGLSVLTLSPADGKAVLKTSSQPLTVVSVGDSILDSPYVVRQVLSDKLLIKDTRDAGIASLVWVYKANAGLASRTERVGEVTPEPRDIASPGISE